MRKHHTRWVALFSAAAISTTGLVGLAGPAAADDKDTRAFSWPVVRQGVSTYSVDGYDIAYLPAGLERYGINASSTTDRQGNSQSQLSWMQGPDQLYGRVAVLRSERIQDLEDLREGRYSHLADSSLEELEAGEAFEHGAYLSEETGDLFWMQRPGVAIATHLQPERWEGRELLKLAEAITEEAGVEEVETEEEAEPEEADEAEAEDAEAEAPTDEAPVEEAPVEEVVDEDGADKPADPVQEIPVDEVPTDEDANDQTPVDEAPAEEDTTDQTPVDEAPAEEDTTDQTPVDEVPAEEDTTDEAPVDEEVVDGDEVGEITPVEDLEEVAPPVEADLPDGASSREVKTCLTEHFVDFRSGQTDLDSAQMTQTSGKFIEKALSKDDLDDAERDRLLATVWYYGDESDKAAATNDCARQFDIERSEVEDVLAEISHLIGQIIQEANESLSQAMDEVEKATGEAGQVTDPVDAEEWAKLWESLPWTLPEETS
ncbi:hypothetical protein NE857_09990 [Nocardiopsis exhalans]|uniref:Uncharacterized protein n=1 Tax=Nocardiopsis exhalans TaxID=163604 RepID=A0ABY5DEK0_9ACTN|nr:hypothetical protein [Nocardiopsis exhalans]USY21903.1 hypothetical protein NE857_09990 [Nocardiopsis exhalans]